MGNHHSSSKNTSQIIKTDDALKTYSTLINMGFSESVSLKAAHKFKTDVNKAIDYAIKHKPDCDDNTNNMRKNVHLKEEKSVDISDFDCQYKSDIKSCSAINRIIDTLIADHKHSIEHNKDTCTQIINDYHHILLKHLNGHDEDTIFELIHQLIFQQIDCNIADCDRYLRNNRNREECDKIVSIVDDILDTIHVYFFHSYDIGYRIKCGNDANEFKNILQKSRDKRDDLIKVRGTNRLTCNKFMTEVTQVDTEENKQDEKTSDNHHQYDKFYSFGMWNAYRQYYQRFAFYVPRKYENLKQEITQNVLHRLDKKRYDEAFDKATIFMRSDQAKCMKSNDTDELDHTYGIDKDLPLHVTNVLVIILYTDYDSLSYNFSKTFRKISHSETDAEARNRNREFWHWSKILNETITFYGISESNITSFYHGVSCMLFHKFQAEFYVPTSTTPKLTVAAIFASNDGLILELKKPEFNPGDLRYFDCSLFSSYGNEDEKLFLCGYCEKLIITSICLMPSGEDCRKYVNAMLQIDHMIDGHEMSLSAIPTMNDMICCALALNSSCINSDKNDSNVPIYIQKCFKRYCNLKEIRLAVLSIDVSDPLKIPNSLIHEKCNNLLLFDRVCSLFQHARIGSHDTGLIGSDYMKLLLKLVVKINQMKDRVLHEIYIYGINNEKCIDDQITQFKTTFHRIGWNVSKIGSADSILVEKMWTHRIKTRTTSL